MRKTIRKEYQTRLLQLSERITREVEQLDEEIRDEREAQGDLAHFGTHNADHDLEFLEVDEALERNEVGILNAVEAALSRVEMGTYGQCAECGCDIPRSRLDAIPWAAYCVDCARARE